MANLSIAQNDSESNNYRVFKTDDGIELVIDVSTGEAFATQAGYARMSGVHYATIRKRVNRLKGGDENELKTTEIQTGGGLQDVTLVPSDIVFDWLLDDNRKLAKAMGKCGATVYLYQLAGFKFDSKQSVDRGLTPELHAKVKAEIDIISSVLQVANLDPCLISGVALNHAGKRVPALKKAIAESHKLLAASLSSELLLTPTLIGQELGISARKVNLILIEIGYQVKNPNASKTQPDYLPSELGKPYASNTLATGNIGDNTTYQHLKWKPQVVNILREQLPLD